MNVEFLPEKVDKLESVFSNILYLKPEDRIVTPNMNNLGDLRDVINSIFDDNKCIDVFYTLNTDKQFFGIRINPLMNAKDAVEILLNDEKFNLVKYQIEFDSKLFDIGLDSEELTAITLYEISNMMANYSIFENLRTYVDYSLMTNDDVISIRDSVNYAQLIIFAIKDTMHKLSNIVYKESEEEFIHDPVINSVEMNEALISGWNKLIASVSGLGETFRSPKPVIMEWMFLMYKDMKINSVIVHDTLTDAKAFTGSRLEKDEIDKTLLAVGRIDSSILESADLNKFFEEKNISSLNEISLFKSLKKNGLRAIENEYYEYAMRVKNCTEADDAFLIMRGINSRLGILEDYLYQENISDHDRKHWESVAEGYRELRHTLSKKKLGYKQYGLFYDYSALDKLDKKRDDIDDEK